MSKRYLLLLMVLGLLIPAVASADFVTSAVAVSGPEPIGDFAWENTIDQSGLTVSYSSGITDFDTFIGSNPMHIASNSPENYGASFTVAPTQIDYDLGSSMFITRIAFWNYPFSNSGGVELMDVYTSDDETFSSSTFVGTFSPIDDGTGLGDPGNAAQVFDLVDTNARYVRIDVRQNFVSQGTGFSEIAFATGTVIPEPTSLGILILVGFAGVSRRSRR